MIHDEQERDGRAEARERREETGMADGEVRALEPEERERWPRAEWAICVATFYGDLADRLVNGAFEGFSRPGPAPRRSDTFEVPGAFELPLAAKLCADTGHFAGVACLGVVIRGETDHYDFVCAEAAPRDPGHACETGVPVLLRRDHLRHPRAGRGPRRRRQARPGPQRRDRGDADAPAGRDDRLG